jgi:predicted TIM-barrel fold metal-dependent hydrolase
MTNDAVLPPGTCDCHVHVVGPKTRFPLQPARSYTPMDAPLDKLRAMMTRVGSDRTVLVQPSFYGTDNSCLLDALDQLGDAARAVVVVAPDVSATELDDMHRRGARGIRLNVASLAGMPIETVRERLNQTAMLCGPRGWHVQLFTPAAMLTPLASTILSLGVDVVIDHFGLIRPQDSAGDPARTLLALLNSGRVWVKLSAPYRIAERIDDPAITPFARMIAQASPERVVWGTDWPHTPVHAGVAVNDDGEMPYRDIDTAKLRDLMLDWIAEPRRRDLFLVDNPARLYDFPR